MTTQMPTARASQQRRARAVYQTIRRSPSPARLLAAEFVLLAGVALAIAGIVGLRAWLALGQ